MELISRFAISIGGRLNAFLAELGQITLLLVEILYWAVIGPFKGKRIRWKGTIEQMVRAGFESIPIVTLIAFFVGLIIAMQSAYQLAKFGASVYVADLVAVSITRELAPLLTAIVVAGRSGSAITAEIGTMKVSEEIDALKTMGFNPISFLVVPRTLAMMIMLPSLTIVADLIGIIGGYVISMATLDVTSLRYVNQTVAALTMKDLASGLTKSFFFAMIIAIIGSHEGFKVKGGADGVGKSTTRSVVTSIFLIIAADVFFTALFFSNI